jgi:hypothetical protein
MISGPNLSKVHQRVDGSEKGTVQPTTTLRDELGYGICLISNDYRDQEASYRERQSLLLLS